MDYGLDYVMDEETQKEAAPLREVGWRYRWKMPDGSVGRWEYSEDEPSRDPQGMLEVQKLYADSSASITRVIA